MYRECKNCTEKFILRSPNAFAVRCRNTTGFHGRMPNGAIYKFSSEQPYSNLRGDLRGDLRGGTRQPLSGQQSRRKSLTSHVFGSPAPVNGGAANRDHRRAAPDTNYRTTLTGAGEPYNGRGERAGIHSVRMQNEHRVTSAIVARRNKFVARHVNESIEPIVSPLIPSPAINPNKINAEADKQHADAPENLSPPRLKRRSGIQCFLCLNQAKPFVNQFFPDFIQRLF